VQVDKDIIMDELIAFLVKFYDGLKVPAKWLIAIAVMGMAFIAVVGFEHFTGHFFFTRLETKIRLLIELHQLAKAGIENDPNLAPIYFATVTELNSIDTSSQLSPSFTKFNLGNPVNIWKAVSGAFLWILAGIIGLSGEIKKAGGKITGNTIGLGVLIFLIVIFFAWIGTIIPTIYFPWINYLGFPTLQILILWLISRKSTKKQA